MRRANPRSATASQYISITVDPDTDWMEQVGRHLLDMVDGPLAGKKYLPAIAIRSSESAFRQRLAREDIRVIRLPPRTPNLNAYAERRVPEATWRRSAWAMQCPN